MLCSISASAEYVAMTTGQNDFLNTITATAVRAFGEEGAAKWLRQPWRVFDGRRPMDMFSHPTDAERVIAYLRELLGAEVSLSQAGLRPSEI